MSEIVPNTEAIYGYIATIGKNSGNSNNYIEIYISPTDTNRKGNYQLVVPGDLDEDGRFDDERMKPKIKFVKRNSKGFDIDYESSSSDNFLSLNSKADMV